MAKEEYFVDNDRIHSGETDIPKLLVDCIAECSTALTPRAVQVLTSMIPITYGHTLIVPARVTSTTTSRNVSGSDEQAYRECGVPPADTSTEAATARDTGGQAVSSDPAPNVGVTVAEVMTAAIARWLVNDSSCSQTSSTAVVPPLESLPH